MHMEFLPILDLESRFTHKNKMQNLLSRSRSRYSLSSRFSSRVEVAANNVTMMDVSLPYHWAWPERQRKISENQSTKQTTETTMKTHEKTSYRDI